MSTELATTQKETRLAHPIEFSNEQVRILSETIAKGCDQNELTFFLTVCKLKKLDPFTGQVHCVKRYDSTLGKDKMSIQVGIDGFRVIAARSGELAGITEPEFDSEDEKLPKWARVTVYRYGRDNEKIEYTAKARYSEYVQTKSERNGGGPNHMWATKPYIMLGKCAEALALRKAFPDELSGMYSDEEMGQADNESGVTPASVEKKKQVNQPSRASEKKTEAPAEQTQQTAEKAGENVISGIIEIAKQAKSGSLWLTVKGEPLLVAVEEKSIDVDMVAGNFIKFRGLKKYNDKMKNEHNPKGNFWELLGLMELSKVEEGQVSNNSNAPLAEDAQAVSDQIFGENPEGGKAAVADMVKDGTLKPASQFQSVTKQGTIGKRRAQRLYTICTQNKANNHGFNEEEIKKILASLPIPLEHLSDLEVNLHSQFEKYATGEEDFKTWWD